MASGIAEVFAKAGFEVVLAARSLEKAEKAKARIAKSLGRSVDKGRLAPEARDAALAAITPAGSLDAFADVDLAVEAVAEDLAVKQELFGDAGQGLQAGRRPGHHHLLAAGRGLRPCHLAPRRTSSGCTSSTRRRR